MQSGGKNGYRNVLTELFFVAGQARYEVMRAPRGLSDFLEPRLHHHDRICTARRAPVVGSVSTSSSAVSLSRFVIGVLGLTWLADIMRRSAQSDRLWWRHVVSASVDRPLAERALALSEPENAEKGRFLTGPRGRPRGTHLRTTSFRLNASYAASISMMMRSLGSR